MAFYELLALLYVLGVSVLDVLMRALQKDRDQSWAIAVVASWVGAAVLLPFVNFNNFHISPSTAVLFLLSGILWATMVYWEFKSLVAIEASTSVIISALRTILLSIIGYLFFHEHLTVADLLGATTICAGILVALPSSVFRRPRGLFLRLGSVFVGGAAIVTDKALVLLTDLSVVIWAGYLLPGLFYVFVRPPNWKTQLSLGSKQRQTLIAFAIALYVIIGPILVTAFSIGNLSSTFFITQIRIVFVLILAALFLKERKNLVRRCLGGGMCLIGVTLIIAL